MKRNGLISLIFLLKVMTFWVFSAGIEAKMTHLNLRFNPDELSFEKADAAISLTDVVLLINSLFKSGERPDHAEPGDVDPKHNVNNTEVVYLINYLFRRASESCS
jgi:hypothetical protein